MDGCLNVFKRDIHPILQSYKSLQVFAFTGTIRDTDEILAARGDNLSDSLAKLIKAVGLFIEAVVHSLPHVNTILCVVSGDSKGFVWCSVHNSAEVELILEPTALTYIGCTTTPTSTVTGASMRAETILKRILTEKGALQVDASVLDSSDYIVLEDI